jgi:SagB-type dehydrogenase family enzyme
MEKYNENRRLMKSNFMELDARETDQEKKLPQPPLQKPYDEDACIIDLPKVEGKFVSNNELYTCLKERRSRRRYSTDDIRVEELSFILWATQGVDKISGNNYATLRPVASGGARHSFETYLLINKVEGIKSGVYRYLALTHQLLFLFEDENMMDAFIKITSGQSFVKDSAVGFIWSCLPYRGEWRYSTAAHKTMLLDAGHLCQNLYIACEAVGCGTCGIAAYDQKYADEYLKLNGNDEFTVYMAPVGKKQI